MGSVRQRRIINQYDIPQDLLLHFIGRGLEINRHQHPIQLEVAQGRGLVFDEQYRIAVDNEIDECKSSVYTSLTDSVLSIDCRKLILTKTYTEYKVCRNRDGLIIDLQAVRTWEDKDEVMITDHTYVSALSTSERENTTDSPNFYKK